MLLEKGYSVLVFCNSAQHSIYFLLTSHHYIKFAISEWNVVSTMRSMKCKKPGKNISHCFVPDKKCSAQFTTDSTKIFNNS